MPCWNLDATILLEEPPDVEVRGGLVYVTDRIGSLTIRRCFRVSTFAKLVSAGSEIMARWQVDQLDKVAGLR
jgi:hypothetical protein